MNKPFSFSFFQEMFDNVVQNLRSNFFNGRISDTVFMAGMLSISELAVKFYDMDSKVVIKQSEFDMLNTAFEAMKEELNKLKPTDVDDINAVNSMLAIYETSFNNFQDYILIK